VVSLRRGDEGALVPQLALPPASGPQPSPCGERPPARDSMRRAGGLGVIRGPRPDADTVALHRSRSSRLAGPCRRCVAPEREKRTRMLPAWFRVVPAWTRTSLLIDIFAAPGISAVSTGRRQDPRSRRDMRSWPPEKHTSHRLMRRQHQVLRAVGHVPAKGEGLIPDTNFSTLAAARYRSVRERSPQPRMARPGGSGAPRYAWRCT
jgi:hypothetical protein